MSESRYVWRRLSDRERAELLAWRKSEKRPWHSPPHRPTFGRCRVLVTAACYEHRPHVGRSPERMDAFSCDLLSVLGADGRGVFAWCVLPNHYHALLEAPDVVRLIRDLGRLHGRSSHSWNGDERTRGRKVFFRAADREIRSEGHFFSTLNYVHHNPVHHGYVGRAAEWPWSSATEYVEQVGAAEAKRVWCAYPLLEYGKRWDEPSL